MAESSEDKAVDSLIDELQSTLDKLKAAQRKDVDDESGESEPKSSKEAEGEALRRIRSDKASQSSGK